MDNNLGVYVLGMAMLSKIFKMFPLIIQMCKIQIIQRIRLLDCPSNSSGIKVLVIHLY